VKGECSFGVALCSRLASSSSLYTFCIFSFNLSTPIKNPSFVCNHYSFEPVFTPLFKGFFLVQRKDPNKMCLSSLYTFCIFSFNLSTPIKNPSFVCNHYSFEPVFTPLFKGFFLVQRKDPNKMCLIRCCKAYNNNYDSSLSSLHLQ